MPTALDSHTLATVYNVTGGKVFKTIECSLHQNIVLPILICGFRCNGSQI
ncbi:hypothetical protein QWZ13_18095 [Reinekea marina]|nr:hypothetical protein [Reinekea marina]MDN3650822.1 hypothetical protein [Reinekea marina]